MQKLKLIPHIVFISPAHFKVIALTEFVNKINLEKVSCLVHIRHLESFAGHFALVLSLFRKEKTNQAYLHHLRKLILEDFLSRQECFRSRRGCLE